MVELDDQPSPPGTALLRFSVRDGGIGIPGEKMAEVFSAFNQVDVSAHAQYGGTGLGLSIAKSLAEMMGGRIWGESTVGEGSTFTFTARFRLGSGRETGDETQASGPAPATMGRLRILLAEDVPVNRLYAQEILKYWGHEVETAEDGRQVLELLREKSFDVVLMDVGMPVMDGMAAMKAIRRGEAGRDKVSIPIVAITAYALKGDAERFLAEGMDDYIPKPVNEEELQRVLRTIIARKGGGGEDGQGPGRHAGE